MLHKQVILHLKSPFLLEQITETRHLIIHYGNLHFFSEKDIKLTSNPLSLSSIYKVLLCISWPKTRTESFSGQRKLQQIQYMTRVQKEKIDCRATFLQVEEKKTQKPERLNLTSNPRQTFITPIVSITS